MSLHVTFTLTGLKYDISKPFSTRSIPLAAWQFTDVTSNDVLSQEGACV